MSLISLTFMNLLHQVLFHPKQRFFLPEGVDDHQVGDDGEEGEPHVGEHHDDGVHQGRGEHMAKPFTTSIAIHPFPGMVIFPLFSGSDFYWKFHLWTFSVVNAMARKPHGINDRERRQNLKKYLENDLETRVLLAIAPP